MSARLRTSERVEESVRKVAKGLDPHRILDGGHEKQEKWRILRLLLAISLRLPVHKGEEPAALKGGDRKGGEYRLRQMTGEGSINTGTGRAEEEDFTDALRAMLSQVHGINLFLPEHQDTLFVQLLEYHLDRGAVELDRALANHPDVPSALIELLAPPGPDVKAAVGAIAAQQVVNAFIEIGVHVELVGDPEEGPRLTHLSLRVPDLNDLDRVKSGLHQVAFALGRMPETLSFEPGSVPRTLVLSLPRPSETWARHGYEALVADLSRVPDGLLLPICAGRDSRGRPVHRDLTRGPHLLIGGATGSGKSVALHAILVGLLLHCTKDELQLVLCDAKGTELAPYEQAPQVRGKAVWSKAADINKQVAGLVTEMEERYTLLQGRKFRDLGEARRGGLALPSLVLVVDELADLLQQVPGVEDSLVRIAQKGRAGGIHLILATQRPDARILSGLLRSNVPARIALAVQRTTESAIILGEGGAESLLPPGDMLVRWNSAEKVRAHGYEIRPDDVAAAVRRAVRSPQ
jgi:S-DNA-T family DNA segregation ATPase FtsK/SpoIIIE